MLEFISVVIILVCCGIMFHFIDESYDDYKDYMDTQNKNNDR